MNLKEEALKLHRINKGKLATKSKVKVATKDDLSLVYTPGVAEVCKEIAANKNNVYALYVVARHHLHREEYEKGMEYVFKYLKNKTDAINAKPILAQ